MKFAKDIPVKIILIGAGGTGGYIIDHLYRIWYSSDRPIRIIVCDGDTVEEKNLIRQHFIAQDIGENKAKVLAERYALAFGMEAEYIPRFIEKAEEMAKLIEPDQYSDGYRYSYGKVILIGAVDNNKSRRICHEVFNQTQDMIYIDSGNGENTGQVVCGIRQKGRTLYKPVCSLYPDMLKDVDKFPSELSCADHNVSAPQSITANLTAATAVISFLYNLLIVGELKTRYVTFSSQNIAVRSVSAKKRSRSAYLKSEHKVA